jgi:hypothetical protein
MPNLSQLTELTKRSNLSRLEDGSATRKRKLASTLPRNTSRI